jgi:hypothetical protein
VLTASTLTKWGKTKKANASECARRGIFQSTKTTGKDAKRNRAGVMSDEQQLEVLRQLCTADLPL